MTEQAVGTVDRPAIARRLLRSVDSGILSTMSVELPGYPFGSVTPYVLTPCGRVVVYVSGIAQHTANMRADAKCCLTVAAKSDGRENAQALGRVTVVGDAGPVPEAGLEMVAERYYSFFPEARSYAETHDFAFYWIEPKRVRYIGGFGMIYWVEAEDWTLARPEWIESQAGIVDHMNADHGESLLKLARGVAPAAQEAIMLTLDVEGFHIRSDVGVHYIPFPNAAWTTEDVRKEMIALAR